MLYRKLGRSGLRVSALSFGSMRWQSESECHAIMQRGLDAGMNYIDTSTGYVNGKSLVWSGRAVRDRRSDILFSCKSDWASAPNADGVRRSIERALTASGLDYLDFWQIWGLQTRDVLNAALAKGGMIEGVRRAQSEGLIRCGLGFTFHGDADVFRAAVDTGEFLCATLSYNLLKRKEENLLRYASEQGLGTFIMNPLAGGVLGRKSDALLPFLQDDERDPAYTAIRFLLANSNISAALLGFAALDQVDADLETLADSGSVNEAFRQDIIARMAGAKLTDESFCTGCGYCRECAQGFDPSELMQALRDYDMAGSSRGSLADWLRRRYIGRSVEDELAKCIACGQCADLCPQHLDIVYQIERAKEAIGM